MFSKPIDNVTKIPLIDFLRRFASFILPLIPSYLIALIIYKSVEPVNISIITIIGLIIIAVFVFITIIKPDIGFILTYIIFLGGISVIINFNKNFVLNMPFGNINFYDCVFLVWMMVLVGNIKRVKAYLKLTFVKLTIIWICYGVFQICYSVILRDCPLERALSDFRVFMYMLMIVPLLVVHTRERQLQRILVFIFCYGLISLTIAFFMTITGNDLPFLAGYTVSIGNYYRVTMVGENVFILLYFSTLFIFLVTKKGRTKWLIFCGLCMMGIIATFSRGLWVAFLVGNFITAIYFIRNKRTKMIFFLFLSIVFISSIVILYFPQPFGSFANTIVERASSGINEVKYYEGNWFSRIARYDFQLLKENLIFGVGYYPVYTVSWLDRLLDPYASTSHNLYLDLILRFGIISLFIMIGFFSILIKRAYSMLNQLNFGNTVYKGIVFGIMMTLIVNIPWQLTTSRYLRLTSLFELIAFVVILELIYKVGLMTKET